MTDNKEMKVGHYYRLKGPIFVNSDKVIVIHRSEQRGLGTIIMDYEYFGSEGIQRNHFTDPSIWEEVW